MHLGRKVALLLLSVSLACALHAQAAGESDAQSASGQSLGDIARRYREHKRVDVQITSSDAKELFASLDKILAFASRDTGFPRRSVVNRKLVGNEEVQALIAKAMAAESNDERLSKEEVVLKKFGLLPANFDLKSFLLKNSAQELGGFYNPKDKTMYLVNWVELSMQKRVMAHELTHALQDQNFNLDRLSNQFSRNKVASMQVSGTDSAERSTVLRAFVEGQAMMVFVDYMMEQAELESDYTPQALEMLRNQLLNYEEPVVLKKAPRVLGEAGAFPYREGLAFELEVLKKAGRQAAFSGAFARSPQSTHEIMQPAAYLGHKHITGLALPDLTPVLGDKFEAFDSGSMGELDARIIVRDFGRENDIYSVAANWNGGAYVAVKPAGTALPTTAGLSLIYVSDWKTPEAAKRFAQIYKASMPKRVEVTGEQVIEGKDCEGNSCREPLWAARLTTSEGPVYVEAWPGNRVIIAQSFDDETYSKLRRVVLDPDAKKVTTAQHELSQSLYELPEFAAFQDALFSDALKAMEQRLLSNREH